MFSLGLGLFRSSASTLASSSRSFSSTAVAQLQKSHSGAKKRFLPSGSGAFKHKQCGTKHLNTGVSSTRINRLAQMAYTSKTQTKIVKRLLPGRL